MDQAGFWNEDYLQPEIHCVKGVHVFKNGTSPVTLCQTLDFAILGFSSYCSHCQKQCNCSSCWWCRTPDFIYPILLL